ncbi:MAG: hypothetical protein IJX26_04390, partial [Clostridia bacterium]|nr:hypothetical protein [Clostridia bacterium]
MSKTEILVLIAVIFVSVSLLSLFLNKLFKEKLEKPKKEKKEEESKPTKQVIEENQPAVSEVKEEIKENKQQAEVPPISVALQDEFNEFKNYLKSRVTAPTEMEIRSKSNDKPKKYRRDNFELDDEFDNFDDFEDFRYGRRRNRQNMEDTPYEELPNK